MRIRMLWVSLAAASGMLFVGRHATAQGSITLSWVETDLSLFELLLPSVFVGFLRGLEADTGVTLRVPREQAQPDEALCKDADHGCMNRLDRLPFSSAVDPGLLGFEHDLIDTTLGRGEPS